MKKTTLLKTMLLLCALIVGSGSSWADTEVTFTPGTDTGETSVTKSGITATLTTMNNASYYQIYANNSGTISCSNGNITKIEFTCTASGTEKYGPGNASANVGSYSYSGTKGTWTGSASSVTISTTAQIRMSLLKVTYTPAAPAYEITAVSNNDTYGTVSLSGSIITGSPNSGYRYATPAYTVTSGTATVAQDGNAFTVTPSSACTVRINFEPIPTHTASFSINGVIDPADNDVVAEGSAITFPSNPSDISGMKFVGWYTAEYRNASVAPSFVNTASTNMGDGDVTYYAVFASGGMTNYTDDLTTSTFGSPGTYTSWTGKSATGGSDAVYAGYSTTYSSTAIQLKSADSVSGIVTTTTGGKAKKVTVTWNSGTTSGRTLDIYGKNTAYTAASNLYGDSKGTKLGSIVYGTSTELTITGDYAYIGMRSNSGALYINKVSIDWENGSYSDYNTTVAVNPSDPVDDGAGHLTLTTTANMDGWRAFYDASQDYSVDGNTTIYVAKKSATEDVVELTAVGATEIPHGEAVILKTTDAGHSMTLTETTGAATLGANVLAVTDGTNNVDGYRMGYGKIGASDAVGFFKYTTTTAPAAGIVYIDKSNVNVSAGAHGLAIDFGETTAIKTVNTDQQNVTPRKVMKDGRIVIESAKGTFTMSGTRMK